MRLHALLAPRRANGPAIIDYLADHFPQVRDNIDRDLHDRWRPPIPTIRAHKLLVYDSYNAQVPHVRLPSLPGADVGKTLRAAIGLHDIGKDLSWRMTGTTGFQHLFTIPILSDTLRQAGFSEVENNLARVLVGNDVIGELLTGVPNTRRARREIKKLAAKAGMAERPFDFLVLQSFFFTIDASSYPYLRKRIFTESSEGKLSISGRPYRTLAGRLRFERGQR